MLLRAMRQYERNNELQEQMVARHINVVVVVVVVVVFVVVVTFTCIQDTQTHSAYSSKFHECQEVVELLDVANLLLFLMLH